MTVLLSLAVALFAGLMMTRACKPLGLPAVTGYLVAGILIGPYCLGLLGVEGLGFTSFEAVESFHILSEAALGFIAFTIGNEFRLSSLKQIGKQAVVIALFGAVGATILVDAALIGLSFLMPGVVDLPVALTLGAIASATAPAATLMVVRQYKAKGPVTQMLLPVVAIDDAIGLIVFAVSLGVAKAVNSGHMDVLSIALEPVVEIVFSIVAGSILGALLSYTERLFHSRSKRLSITVAYVLLGVAISQIKFHIGPIHCGFSSLLLLMMMGTVFCNMCDFSEELMDRLDRWTGPLFALFFVLSGAELQLSVFTQWTMVVVGIVYIIFRCLGKYFGASFSAKITHCEKTVQDYLGITLFPQAGVALGMTLIASAEFGGAQGDVIRNITLFSVMVYELVGPLLTKIALTKAGEIKPEERKSSRGVMHH
ncbi:MAG: cation:proton antiporter [Ruminococcaceae bacterium]|nr:cation:proton antiporter [Oscillospiraceae bacterium]